MRFAPASPPYKHPLYANLPSSASDTKYFDLLSEEEGQSTPRTILDTVIRPSDSGSDNDRVKKDEEYDPDSTPKAKSLIPRASYSSLNHKSGVEPTTKNMTVETETVSSIPQATLGATSDRVASGRAEHGGTLRVKASNETIRPGKGRKKASRKAPSINAASGMFFTNDPFTSSDTSQELHSQQPAHHHSHNSVRPNHRSRMHTSPILPDNFSSTSTADSDTASTSSIPASPQLQAHSGWTSHLFRKFSFTSSTDSRLREASTRADIFEDRVKDAMDLATSDDSEETFVYESNPPEPPVRRSRHHSRTPSGTSVVSAQNQQAPARAVQNVLSAQKTRSMKFSNAYSSGPDDETLDRQDGTIRASNNRNGGSSIQHHHLGRPGRNNTGHTSILDDDNSPFPQLTKVRSLTGMPGRQSQNARYAARNLHASNGISRKGDGGYSSYDMDAEGGDDERTPLMGTTRTPRGTRRSTLQSTRPRYPEHYPRHQRSLLSRCAGFVVLLVMLLLLAFGVVGFLFAISTPLADVSIIEIQAVLASEQELMFDLVIGAMNPNLLPINVADMDIDVFAKSKYVRSEKWWREHGNETFVDKEKPIRRKSRTQRLHYYQSNSDGTLDADDVDPSVDPTLNEEELETNRSTMLLGRIDHFDNPLSFDGSFWRRHTHYSTGSVRLSKPGNLTEIGGSERWNGIILHSFDLIVRGTLKYKIPLGGRAYAANIRRNTTVHPEQGIDTEPHDGHDREGRVHISRSIVV
jgi:hypothetical protein